MTFTRSTSAGVICYSEYGPAHRRRQIRPPRRAATGERGFSAACHPSVTGFNFYRCPFQDVRLNTFWASSENGASLGGWAALGPPRGVPLFSARPRHARLKSGRQRVLLLRYFPPRTSTGSDVTPSRAEDRTAPSQKGSRRNIAPRRLVSARVPVKPKVAL